jgi:hypothetical protein
MTSESTRCRVSRFAKRLVASRYRDIGRVGRAVSAALVVAVLGLLTSPAADADDHERAAELYFDRLALELAEPGLWIDPESRSRITPGRAAELDRAAKDAPVPMRLAVIPASVLVDPDRDSLPAELLWESPEMATKLYERVGLDGVYAILVDARSSRDGRGFWAVQHADDGPTYHVGDAVDQAIECCAPSYGPILERFIQRASEVDDPLYVVAAPWAAAAVGVFGLWWAGASAYARRQQRREEQQHLLTVRPLLNEEVIELSEEVSILPTTSDIEQARLTREILNTVEQARHRLDALTADDDIQAVTTLLGNARYLLHWLTALHRGEPKPERTPPCFFDPRHGPSTQRRQWAPSHFLGRDGAQREISTCAECAERIDNDQTPEARMVGRRQYWEAGEDLVAYIEGYWRTGEQSWRFPDSRHYQAQNAIRLRRHDSRPAQRLNRAAHALFTDTAPTELYRLPNVGGGSDSSSFGGGSSSSSSVSSSGGGRF